jgi:hypothetical protein
MNDLIIYQSKSRIGGDANFSNEFQKNIKGEIYVHSLCDEFIPTAIFKNIFHAFSTHGISLLGLPLSSLLAEFKGLSKKLKLLNDKETKIHLVGPRLVHASLTIVIQRSLCTKKVPLFTSICLRSQ